VLGPQTAVFVRAILTPVRWPGSEGFPCFSAENNLTTSPWPWTVCQLAHFVARLGPSHYGTASTHSMASLLGSETALGGWLGWHVTTGLSATQQWNLLLSLSLFGSIGCGSSTSLWICTVYAVQNGSLKCNRSSSSTRTCPSCFTSTSATNMDLHPLPRLITIRLVPLAPGLRTCSTRTARLRRIPVGSQIACWDQLLSEGSPRVPHHDSQQALAGQSLPHAHFLASRSA